MTSIKKVFWWIFPVAFVLVVLLGLAFHFANSGRAPGDRKAPDDHGASRTVAGPQAVGGISGQPASNPASMGSGSVGVQPAASTGARSAMAPAPTNPVVAGAGIRPARQKSSAGQAPPAGAQGTAPSAPAVSGQGIGAPSGSPRSIAEIVQGVDMSNPAMRAQVVAQIQEKERIQREHAVAKARRLGIPLRVVNPDGSVMELRDFRGDEPLYLKTSNRNAAISSGANLLFPAPYSLSGSGIKVGVWDEGSVRSSHQELTGRASLKNSSAQLSDHSTHVAGTIGASGVVAQAKGMAPQATIDSYDWNSDYSEMTAAGAAAATDVTRITMSNHSYGLNPVTADMGRYDSEANSVDALAVSLPYYLIFWAAGNEQDVLTAHAGYQSITFCSLAKNIVTVGAVDDAVSGGVRSLAGATMSSFSSWGPCDDGRIKPDLVANGVDLYSSIKTSNTSYDTYSGTSMATPSATGSSALLEQLYSREFSGQLLRAGTLKALLIHTADDLGPAGPDYKFGWGLINVKRASDLILEHKASLASPKLIENTLTTAQKTRTHTFVWDGTTPIRATLCWLDPAGAVQAAADSRTPNLVHNLDLKITAPDGTTSYLPYAMPFVGTWTQASMASAATKGKNNVDTVEQVYIPAPVQAGTYTMTVSIDGALTTSSQAYSLVVTGGAGSAGATRTLALEGDLAFGNLAVGSTLGKPLAVRNLGTAALTVQSISLPAGFTANQTNFTVAAGGQQSLTVTFAPTAAQSYSGSLTVTSNATSGANSVPVSGSGIAESSVQVLQNNVVVPGLSGAASGELFFRIPVPAGQQSLTFTIQGGTGDSDLYVRKGSAPTTSLWDYRPYLAGNNETVTVTNPAAGDWFVLLHGYSAYSGVSLLAKFEAPVSLTRILRLSGDLDFGFIPVGGSLRRTLTLFNDGNAPLLVSGISLPQGFSASWTSGTIAAGGSQAVDVTFSPAAASVYSGVLTVASNKTSGPNTSGLTASGTGAVAPLTNGVPTPAFNGSAGFGSLFQITVPAGQAELKIQTTGGTGGAALYLQKGAAPSTTTYDFASQSTGTAELITVSQPAAGDWFILVAPEPQFSGVILTASYSATSQKTIRLAGDLAFGSVRVGQTPQRILKVYNDGNAPLTLGGMSLPDGFSATGITGTIQPLTSRDIAITFSPLAGMSYGGVITVQSDKTSGTETIACSGVGQAVDSTTALANGVPVSGLSGATGSQTYFRVAVPAGATQLEISIAGGTGDADLYVRKGSKPTLDTYDFSPYLYGNDETATISNPQSGDWYILIDGYNAFSGLTLVATYTVPGSATRIIGLSGSLAFGNVTLPQSARRTLNISNAGTDVLSVSGITYPTGFSGNWSSGDIAAGTSRNVAVTFAPDAAQSYGGTITVASNSSSGSSQIACSGTGQPAVTRILGISGDVDFGTVTVGGSLQRLLTLTNTGNSPLAISGLSFSSAAFSANWSGTIPAGGSKFLSVTFAPATAGTYNETVTVISNATSGASELALTGTATAGGGAFPAEWRAILDGAHFVGLAGGLQAADGAPDDPLGGHGIIRIQTGVDTTGGFITGGSLQLGKLHYKIGSAGISEVGQALIVGLHTTKAADPVLALELHFELQAGVGIFTGRLIRPGAQDLAVALRPQAHTGKSGDVSQLADRNFNGILEVSGNRALGHGFLTLKALRDGAARITGRLSNGGTFTCAADGARETNGTLRWEATIVLESGKSLLVLSLLAPETGSPLLQGTALWIKGMNPRSRFFPQSFSEVLEVTGGEWIKPASSLLQQDAFRLSLDPLGITSFAASAFDGSWGNNKPVFTSPPKGLTIRFAPATGTFSGTLPYSQSGSIRILKFQGLVLPEPFDSLGGNLLQGAGFLLDGANSAPIEIRPLP